MEASMETIRVVSGVERKRRFSEEQKREIVAETYSGRSVLEVARKHRITSGLLYKWRQIFSPNQATPSELVSLKSPFARVVEQSLSASIQVIKVSKGDVTFELPLNTDPMLLAKLIKRLAE